MSNEVEVSYKEVLQRMHETKIKKVNTVINNAVTTLNSDLDALFNYYKDLEIFELETAEKIFKELEKAKKFPPFASLHEGYAVLKEEVEEFWDIVKTYKYHHDEISESDSLVHAEKELIQIAAMAVKNLQLVETMKAKIQGKNK